MSSNIYNSKRLKTNQIKIFTIKNNIYIHDYSQKIRIISVNCTQNNQVDCTQIAFEYSLKKSSDLVFG